MAWQSDNAPCDNLYVKGLPEAFTSDAVNQFFSACGTVTSAKSLGNGVALVRFASEEEATQVREAMNGQQPMGCDQPITISYSTSGGGKGGGKGEDWYCPACGDLQFAKNFSCRLCGAAKADGGAGCGKGGAVKGCGKALQAAGDWNCVECGDMQFARNTDCRKCGAPKAGWGPGGAPYGKAGGKKGGDGSTPYGGGAGAAKAKGKGFRKTKLCSNYEQGWCPRGEVCTFAHGEAELGTFQAGQGGPQNATGWKPAEGWAGAKDASKIAGLVDGLIAEGLPGAAQDKESNALYVTNMPHDTTDADLYVIFASFGAIPPRGVRVMPTQPGNRSYGFVNFMESANAEFAMMAMNGVTQPDGAKLIVKQKAKKGESTGGPEVRFATPFGASAPALSGPSAGVTPAMMARLQKKLAMGPMSSYDISQWYIIEYLSHVTDEEEMKKTCDMLLTACSHMGLV